MKANWFQAYRSYRTPSPWISKTEAVNKEAIMTKASSMAIPFVKNVGQFDSQVKYAADLFGGRFFLTDKELVYSLIKRSPKKNAKQRQARPEG
ncbi:MAG: hypothetical protein M0C28_19245 [Candidatus Moduliflexus flocculans]|nr:hypothetical protein [Candidatus Moduliflexus flocculans]